MYDKIILDNEKLVYHIVNTKYNHNTDLYDVGLIGLIKGVKSFDPSKGYTLSTYLTKCINNEILMTFRKKDTLDVNYKSLDETWDNDVLLYEVVPDGNILLVDEVIENDQINKLYELIDELSSRDQFIICSLYGLRGYKKMRQKELRKQLNCNQPYVSRLKKKILKKLRGGFHENIYKD